MIRRSLSLDDIGEPGKGYAWIGQSASDAAEQANIDRLTRALSHSERTEFRERLGEWVLMGVCLLGAAMVALSALYSAAVIWLGL